MPYILHLESRKHSPSFLNGSKGPQIIKEICLPKIHKDRKIWHSLWLLSFPLSLMKSPSSAVKEITQLPISKSRKDTFKRQRAISHRTRQARETASLTTRIPTASCRRASNKSSLMTRLLAKQMSGWTRAETLLSLPRAKDAPIPLRRTKSKRSKRMRR